MEYQRKCAQPFHWPSLTAPGTAAAGVPAPPLPPASIADDGEQERDINPLQSFNDIKQHRVRGEGGDVMGAISDMLVDDEHRTVRYFVIDTGSWLPGKKVLVAPRWVEEFRWSEKEMRVDLTADTVRSAPGYDPADLIDRVYEEQLYKAFGTPVTA